MIMHTLTIVLLSFVFAARCEFTPDSLAQRDEKTASASINCQLKQHSRDRRSTEGQCGPKGMPGDPSNDGLPGGTGEKGEKGEPGITGDKGDVGQTGHPGPLGPKGHRGIKGPKGNQGGKGITGSRGDVEIPNQGEKGYVGLQKAIAQDNLKGILLVQWSPLSPSQKQDFNSFNVDIRRQVETTFEVTETTGAENLNAESLGYYIPLYHAGVYNVKVKALLANDYLDVVPERNLTIVFDPTGDPGEPGSKGAKGAKGAKGDMGPHGERGTKGPPGEKGDTGPAGSGGKAGENGEPGSEGDVGNTGGPGRRGKKGSQGQQGATGSEGDRGNPGVQGHKGEKGQQGSLGEKGNDIYIYL